MLILGALGTFCLAYVLVPWGIALCWRLGILDVPRDGRRMHAEAVPRGGGAAILLPMLLFCAITGVGGAVLPMLAGSLLMLFVGLADDVFCMSAPVKLLFEFAAALAVVLGSGYEGRQAFFALFWVVLLTNAHNMTDGMDGLFSGSALIECLLLGGALMLSGNAGWEALFLLAASLGAFLCFNRYPACVFAGDGGSLSVGFLLGACSLPLFFRGGESFFSALAPVFLFAYPLTELATSVLRRLLHGRSPFRADRAHLHHRLYAAGLSVPECTSLLHAAGASVGSVGLFLSSQALWGIAAIAAAVAAVILVRVRLYILRTV